jgi:hypothetical protein
VPDDPDPAGALDHVQAAALARRRQVYGVLEGADPLRADPRLGSGVEQREQERQRERCAGERLQRVNGR